MPEKQNQASLLFDMILTQKETPIEKIRGAFVSTAEPQYFSLCLDRFRQFKIHTLMYEMGERKNQDVPQETKKQMITVESEQLTEAVEFAKAAIGAQKAITRAGLFAANRIIQFDR